MSLYSKYLEEIEVRKNELGLNPLPIDSEELLAEIICLLYTSPSPRDRTRSRMPSSA